MKEAMFYKKLKNALRCDTCARNCLIAEGKAGFCRVRKNINGKLYLLTYGKICSAAVDPIEKKPLYMFAPGSRVFPYPQSAARSTASSAATMKSHRGGVR
jgi:pyruvate formate lyase activating enzyme